MDRARKSVWTGRLVRLLILWAAQTAALVLLAAVVGGIEISGDRAALLAVAAITVVNALLYPLLIGLTRRLVLITGGLFSLVVNGGLVLLVSTADGGLTVDGLGQAILVALTLTLAGTVAAALFALDDQAGYYRRVVRSRAAGRSDAGHAERGVLFIEIDGLSEPVLREALEQGWMPNLSRWIESGSHAIAGWECDLSSQTGASQAGLLHGTNENMPAFRWYERSTGRTIVSNKPADAEEIESRVSDGDGLLTGGGSRGNLLSGDASYTAFTLSRIRDRSRERAAHYDAFFASPANVPRTFFLFVAEVIREIRDRRRARRQGIEPRLDQKRKGIYPLLRAGTTVVLRDLATATLIGDSYAGVPVAYATFVGYDEVAHHSGPRSTDALRVLKAHDRRFAKIERAAEASDTEYDLVVLSDHGQSHGATFKQRFGITLEQLVADLGGSASRSHSEETDEGMGHLNAVASEAIASRPSLQKAVERRGRSIDEPLNPTPGTPDETARPDSDADADSGPPEDEAIVFASGNLGLIYLGRRARRLSRREIEAERPGLIEGLAAHPGIAWVLVADDGGGSKIVGGHGTRDLETGAVDGEDPLAALGPAAAKRIARTDRFEACPDLLIGSMFDPATGEVAAFEELIGSHGGIGGEQSRPFVLHPVGLAWPPETPVGAAAVHQILKAWVRDGPPSPAPLR